MRRSKTVTLSEAILDYVRALGIERKIEETSMMGRWEEFVGKYMASTTSNLYFHEGVLYVSVRSSVVRNELIMIREGLRDKINKEMGKELIKSIVVR